MKKFVRILFSAFLLSVLSAAGLSAQYVGKRVRSETYFGRSVSPKEDSLVIARMRVRLDSIRQHRPTVALVMSGGGAKGAAHIGVLHYLDSLRIPYDVVIGTSIGGLMGGLVSTGYGWRELDTIVRGLDWNALMRDKLPREYMSYRQMRYNEKYLISMPFYYMKENSDASGPDRLHADLHIAADEDRESRSFKDNLLGSLPSGYVYGQNISNLFSSLTVGYQDSLDFMKLPIPYACVSTDLRSGKTKVWYDGPLNTALRSTMSIPGVFTPVKYKDYVLVDGGMRDNYPTDIARQIGADIIIGVDVTTPPKSNAPVQNFGDVVSRSMDMFEREVYERNVYIPDVSIRPDLMGLNMLSFSKENIARLIRNGYEAARDNDSALVAIKRRIGQDSLRLYAPRAVSLKEHPIVVGEVNISGADGGAEKILKKKMDIHPGDTLSHDRISRAIALIYATGAYDYVTYELHGNSEPYNLDIICKKGPVHQFGLGLRADTEEFVTAVVNVGLFANRIQGSTLNLDARLCLNPELKISYSYDSPVFPTVNVSASARWTQARIFRDRTTWPTLDCFSSGQEVFLSGMKWSYFDMKLGLSNSLFFDNTSDAFLNSVFDASMTPMNRLTNYMGVYLNGSMDNNDRGYFPRKGVKMKLSYDWTFTDYNRMLPDGGLHTAGIDFTGVIPLGRMFSIIPSLNARLQFGGCPPIVLANAVGGQVAGRYFEQQMPFMGVPKLMMLERKYGLIRSDFRLNPAKNHYVTGIFNCLYTFDDFREIKSGYGIYGAALEYSYNTIFGPVTANLNWSDKIHHMGFYISFGYNF